MPSLARRSAACKPANRRCRSGGRERGGGAVVIRLVGYFNSNFRREYHSKQARMIKAPRIHGAVAREIFSRATRAVVCLAIKFGSLLRSSSRRKRPPEALTIW